MAWTERYVRSDAAGGGNGTTDTNSGANGAWTLAEAITNATSGQRVNIKAGTYANTTTSRVFSNTGTTTSPIWWRGFNTTIGDCDTDPSLTRPLITFTTGTCNFNGGHAWWSSLSFESSRTAGSGFTTGGTAPITFVDCLFTQTGTNAASVCFSHGNASILFYLRCGFIATSSATSVCTWNGGTGGISVFGCWFEGGATQGILTGGAELVISKSVLYDIGGDGIKVASTSSFSCIDCDFYSCSGDGIEMSSAPGGRSRILNNTFVSNGGYGINNSTGGNLNIPRMCNFFYNNTSGEENGFGDSPSPGNVSGTASPYVDAANRDMRKTTASEIQDKGFPAWWVKNAWPASADGTNEFGAMQPATTVGGGGLAANPLRGFIS